MGKNKKLVILAGYSPSLINFRLNLLMDFQKKGYDVVACAPQNINWVVEKLANMNIPFFSFPFQPAGIEPGKDLLFIKKFSLFLNYVRPDIFFSYTIKPVIYGSFAAKIAHIPHIFSFITGLGYTFDNKTLKQKFISPLTTILYREALKFNEAIFFQNNDDLFIFKKKKILNEKANTIVVDGSGIDLACFSFSSPKLSNRIIFLLIARLLKSKGIIEYIKAAEIVKEKYPNAEFHLVGYFYNSPDAIDKDFIFSAHRSGTIIYHGETNDVRPFIKDSSVYVLPSYREGTPRTVLEAMAIGRPIITTDVPGCKETVKNGENGFLIPARNVDKLAQTMIYFIEHPEFIPQMGSNSRKFAEQKYDVHKVNAAILSAMGI